MLVITGSILIIAYIVIAWELIPKVTAAMLGASLMMLLSRSSADKIFPHIDFAVIFLLIGMMIIVNITSRSGVFKWLGIETLKRTQGNPRIILVTFGCLTALLSAFLNNATVIVLMLPLIYTVSERLKISAVPFLLTIIFAANIGGTATLIGDPPNILIGMAAHLSFVDFLRELTPIVTVVLIATIAILLWYYRRELTNKPEYKVMLAELSSKGVITDRPLMIRSLVVIAVVILGFVFQGVLHVDAYIWALLGASVLLLGEEPKQIMLEVDWTTIFFFIGLFIMVGGFCEAGGIKLISHAVITITKGNAEATTFLLLWASGLFSAIIDNIPYTVTMIPMIQTLHSVMDITPLWWSLSLGACLGGNATIIGAAANLIGVESSLQKGQKISFLSFAKVGVLVTLVSLLICSGYLYFRFFC